MCIFFNPSGWQTNPVRSCESCNIAPFIQEKWDQWRRTVITIVQMFVVLGFFLGNRPWTITEKTACGYTTMQLKVVFYLYCIYLYLSIYMFIFILFVIFIYSFTVPLPAARKCTWNCGTCTYIHDECPPDWERCPQYDSDSLVQLTTVSCCHKHLKYVPQLPL